MGHVIKLSPSNITFEADGDQSVLQAALQHGIHLPHSCGNGSCGVCKAKLLRGQVNSVASLTIDDNSPSILTCVSKALSDLEIEAVYFPELEGVESKTYPCKVNSIEFPVDDVAVLKVRLPPNAGFRYLPGQYVDLIHGGVARSYSVAGFDEQRAVLEFHIRKVDGGYFSDFIFSQVKREALLRLRGPQGTFFVRKGDSPIIFVVGGTGFAPAKAMIEDLLARRDQRPIHLYWGARNERDFYSNLPSKWQEQYPHIKSTLVVSDNPGWSGRQGLVHQAVLEDFASLAEATVYACGSPQMISVAGSAFVDKGLLPAAFIADAFLPTTLNK